MKCHINMLSILNFNFTYLFWEKEREGFKNVVSLENKSTSWVLYLRSILNKLEEHIKLLNKIVAMLVFVSRWEFRGSGVSISIAVFAACFPTILLLFAGPHVSYYLKIHHYPVLKPTCWTLVEAVSISHTRERRVGRKLIRGSWLASIS